MQDYQANLLAIVTRITPRKSILITPSPVDEKRQHARTNQVLMHYSQAVARVSAATGCTLVDLFKAMLRTYP